MKKYVISVLVLVLMLSSFSACGKSEAVKNTQELIEGIGAITADSEELIAKAEKAYSVLTDEEKADVKNYDILEKARADFDAVTKAAADYKVVSDNIANVYTVDGITYKEIEDGFNAFTESYNAMPEELKAIAGDYAALETAFNDYKAGFEDAVPSAVSYVKAFNELYKDKNYTITDIGCIMQEREGSRAGFYGITYTDAEGNEANIYSTAKFPKNTAVETILQYKDSCFVTELRSDRFNSILNRNVILDVDAVLAAAQ